MNKYRILTFDGGGIRGALTVTLLRRIHQCFPQLIHKTDLFAGTSTGSFIALGLAYGMSPRELVKLFSLKNGKFIFSPRYLNLCRPRYDNKHLIKLLKSIFPTDLQLKDLKHRVLVPAFKVCDPESGCWNTVFFNNFPESKTKEHYVLDVALASSAAPTYFPSHKQYIDGGVIANNPSTAAIAMSQDDKGRKQRLDNIHLLSIGTGFNPHQIVEDTEDWGVLEWAIDPPSPPRLPILNLLLDGVIEADVCFSSQLLGERYLRLNPVLPHSIALDAYTQIPFLITLGKNFNLTAVNNWITEYWF